MTEIQTVLNPNIAERLYAKVVTAGECLIWTGQLSDSGYGLISNFNKRLRAHRVAWMLGNGPIPEGLLVDHKCHNRACVRIGHLRLATNKQNMENLSVFRSATGYRGVRYNPSNGRFYGVVVHNGQTYSCGGYKTAAACNKAVVKKRNELYTHNDLDK